MSKHTFTESWTLEANNYPDVEVRGGEVRVLGVGYKPAQVPELCAALREAALAAAKPAIVPPSPELAAAAAGKSGVPPEPERSQLQSSPEAGRRGEDTAPYHVNPL
jgi:hypothetical protein